MADRKSTQKAPNLDDILSDALAEYVDEDSVAKGDLAGAATRAVQAQQSIGFGVTPKSTPVDEDDATMKNALQQMMEDMKDPEFQRVLNETLTQLTASTASGAPVTAPAADSATLSATAAATLFSTLSAGDGVSSSDSLMKTLEMLQRLNPEGVEPGTTASGSDATEKMSEDVINRMMEEFEQMGRKEDFNSSLEGMMKQLLAKDLMYLPMKQICEKFPEWLARNRSALSKDDYEKYGKQYQCFQLLVIVYETEPDNFARLAALMQQLQEYGNPPNEIVKDLAPGLELSPDGMPQMPGLPPFPSMDLGGGGQCVIM